MKSKYLAHVSANLLFILFAYNLVGAQSFIRAEKLAGLDELAENNGAAVADYDADNDLDIFVVAKSIDQAGNQKTHSRLYRNNNDGTFNDVTIESALIGALNPDEPSEETVALAGYKYGASWGDYNNDGYPDILLTYSLKIQLFLNLGNGTFKDVTESSGIKGFNNCITPSATWYDYNNDGFLDLHITPWGPCESERLYENNQNGTFSDVSNKIEIVSDQFLYSAFPFDFNKDGWMDLFITNDLKRPNPLLINQNADKLIDDANTYGVANNNHDMGIAIGDYNGDQNFDFYITNINRNYLLKNNGDNTFNDVSDTHNVRDVGWAWDTKFVDFDLDGDEDLYVVNGYDLGFTSAEYNGYYKNLLVEGHDQLAEASESVNLKDLTISVSAVDFDYDNDGDIDIFLTNSDRSSYLYENKLIDYNKENNLNWFKVILQGTQSNRNAIGTILTLTTKERTIKRYFSGVGFLGQSLAPVHFGLNNETVIDQLTIEWPSGIVETHNNLNSNTTIRATEGQGFQLLDIQPSIKTPGCTDPSSCNYNPSATIDDNSCTYVQVNAISGNTNSGFLSTDTYSYPIQSGSTAKWEVKGGEIIEGWGTNSVTVKWGVEETGSISVVEVSPNCSSLPATLNVNLNINALELNKSIARIWNEALLEAIRNDFARPTVHARNLFHTGIALYDSWAIYDAEAKPYFIGNTLHNYSSELNDFEPQENKENSIRKTMCYAAYRLLTYRFANSPGYLSSKDRFDLIMDQLGYDKNYNSLKYESGNAAALGNYLANEIINFGQVDGSREESDFDNAFYTPINPPLAPDFSGNEKIIDPNRWQPLDLETFIDQSGNLIEGNVPEFLNPEWGSITPFALDTDDLSTYQRDGQSYMVYNDPLDPPYLDDSNTSITSEAYKWGFSLVSIWSSHLDPNDGVLWDISPNSKGNINLESLEGNVETYPDYYNLIEGGDVSAGYAINPKTNTAYKKQIVPRGDYARVLAEFWADGPDSETPPGHWFSILNHVNDHPLTIKKFKGEGNLLSSLEWDVKSYFILGGAMHDAAISAWSIKGWYDYIRPISAIRYMADKGQSTDTEALNFHPEGIKLIDGYIEIVKADDPLAGKNSEHLGKIKLYTWKGHSYINNPETDDAGAGWILAENWWPYQRPSFVTPPFAGYVSGHSTYSRAAAEILTLITGDAYFPGGMGEFLAKKDEFLVFEKGPSVDVILQWATYRDASDQCSLSRIWGGIHPPADDIPGRIIGEKIGVNAFEYAVPYFSGKQTITNNESVSMVYPNPISDGELFISNTNKNNTINLYDIMGRLINFTSKSYDEETGITQLKLPDYLTSGIYILRTDDISKVLIIN